MSGRPDLAAYMSGARGLVRDEITRLFGPHDDDPLDLYELILDYPMREGKALRPTLAIATCRALGGYLEAVLPTAATLELYHNAFLVHDDIEDGSLMRRGAATLHLDHGIPIAVNVGDAMLMLSLEPLLGNVSVVGLGPALKILRAVSVMSRKSVQGQALELAWTRRNEWVLSDDDYRTMVVQKTGWYSFVAPMQVGAIAAGADDKQLAGIEPFALELGIAFQITDDLLNLRADPEEYGKEIGGDLWEGKRTVMLLHALRTASVPDRERAIAILAKPRPDVSEPNGAVRMRALELWEAGEISDRAFWTLVDGSPDAKTLEDVSWLADLVRSTDSLAYAAGVARDHAEHAAQALRELTWIPDNHHRQVLEALVDFVHERTR